MVRGGVGVDNCLFKLGLNLIGWRFDLVVFFFILFLLFSIVFKFRNFIEFRIDFSLVM